MADDFLSKVLGNAARAKVLRAFIFSPTELFTLPTVAKRSGAPLKAVAKEIKALEDIGIIKKGKLTITLANTSKRLVSGKQKEQTWHFNTDFKHGRALSKFVHEVSPVSHSSIILALKGSGRLAAVILSGSFVGDPTRPADLIIAADGLNEGRLERAIRTLEPEFGREIRYAAFSTTEFRYRLTVQDRLIRDTLDYPHLVLLDRARLL